MAWRWASYQALVSSSIAASLPPIRNARSVFLFFVAEVVLRETKLMAGNYPSSHRHRRPARRFVLFCFVRSPRARLKKPGMAWTRRIDERPNLDENKEPRVRLNRIPPSG
jgi:hypothetical protein